MHSNKRLESLTRSSWTCIRHINLNREFLHKHLHTLQLAIFNESITLFSVWMKFAQHRTTGTYISTYNEIHYICTLVWECLSNTVVALIMVNKMCHILQDHGIYALICPSLLSLTLFWRFLQDFGGLEWAGQALHAQNLFILWAFKTYWGHCNVTLCSDLFFFFGLCGNLKLFNE